MFNAASQLHIDFNKTLFRTSPVRISSVISNGETGSGLKYHEHSYRLPPIDRIYGVALWFRWFSQFDLLFKVKQLKSLIICNRQINAR